MLSEDVGVAAGLSQHSPPDRVCGIPSPAFKVR